MSVSVPGAGGYSDIFIHTYAWAIFWLKILNFNIFFIFFLVFRKNEYFGGCMKNIFGVLEIPDIFRGER